VAFSTDTALIWVMLGCAGLGLVLGILGTFLLLHRRHR
jgi:ABC-type Mn2+/Zn2+ transport system permease subunit